MFRVYKQPCKECLFSKRRIVPAARAIEIIQATREQGNHFVCHQASMRGESVCCRKFFDTQDTRAIQLVKRFEEAGCNVIDWVEQPDPEEDPCVTYELDPKSFEKPSD